MTAAAGAKLDVLRPHPHRVLLAMDYDGTLAPVVSRPEQAVPADGALAVLTALADQGFQVALVTGRPAQAVLDLGGFAGVRGLRVEGQYGAERWADGRLWAPEPTPGIDVLRAELPALLRAEGAELEDKGLSLVVHTRNAPDPLGAQDRLAGPLRRRARQVGLELHRGRLVLELRPPGFDKRLTLLRLAEGAAAVFFAGDDVGDIPAFDALDQLRSRAVPCVSVFSDSAEGPAQLRDRADVVVDGPAGVVALLDQLSG